MWYNSAFVDCKGIYPDAYNRTKTRFIIIHHDDINRSCTIKEIDDYHRYKRGWWTGFAYHEYITNDNVYQIHNPDSYTIHAGGVNSIAVGVCLHGDFTRQKLSLKQAALLVITVWKLQWKYKISANRVLGHCEVEGSCTACPAINMDILRFFCFN